MEIAILGQLTSLKSNITTITNELKLKNFKIVGITFPICNAVSQGRNPGLRAYNSWLKSDGSGNFDSIIDFAQICQDPNNLDRLKDGYTAIDSLHSSRIANTDLVRELRKVI